MRRCPKCGEPARIVILRNAYVRCFLHEDGSPGKVLSVDRIRSEETPEYECGGAHRWVCQIAIDVASTEHGETQSEQT